MTIDEVRTSIANWKAIKRSMMTLAAKQSKLPDPNYIQIFGWHVTKEDKVIFYYDITCGASDKQEKGVVLCELKDIVELNE